MQASRFWPLLLLTLSAALRAQPCGQSHLDTAQQRVKTVQSQLLAFKLHDEMDENVPEPLQRQIGAFKDALASFADAALRCAPAGVDPKVLESDLAARLDANKPVVQEVYDSNKPPQLDHIYGEGLAVKVSRQMQAPQILLIEFNFGIDCGADSVLLAYERRDGAWKQALRWQSPAYNSVDAAFGDFFDYLVLPGENSNSWQIVVAHGTPWCTSRWSGFGLDLVRPASDGAAQKVLQHVEEGYVRFEIQPTLKLEPGGFQLRLQTGMIDQDIMTRVGIYRYQVRGTQIERVQPIANNGRDFVDEWLQSPWCDAARWSSPASLSQLLGLHKRIESLRDPDAKSWPAWTFGPVRGCSDSRTHYQVELDEEWFDSKGNSRPEMPTYFQIDEGKNSFTMLSASAQAAPGCAGSDIMAKR